MADNKRNVPSVKSFEDFFKKYKIDGYITADDLPDLSPYATSGDLDSYVKTADIVDDITTGGEGKPLSAEQGKILAGLSLYADDPYGSNSNGYYLKFANGWMICFKSIYYDSATFSATGSVYYRSLGTVTFPITFNDSFTPIVIPNASFTNIGQGRARTPSITSFTADVLSAVSTARALTFTYIAIGRWADFES